MRVLLQAADRIGDADQPHQFHGAFLSRGAIDATVLFQGFGDLASDGQHRVQGGHRLLEHHADFAAAHLAHLLLGQGHQVASAEQDGALGDASGRVGDQSQDGQGADGFARAAFADDGHGFARVDGVGDPVNGVDCTCTGPKFGVQVLDF